MDCLENYDLFCEVNKENEKRRAMSCFFVHLMNNGVISKGDIYTLMNKDNSNSNSHSNSGPAYSDGSLGGMASFAPLPQGQGGFITATGEMGSQMQFSDIN